MFFFSHKKLITFIVRGCVGKQFINFFNVIFFGPFPAPLYNQDINRLAYSKKIRFCCHSPFWRDDDVPTKFFIEANFRKSSIAKNIFCSVRVVTLF